MASNNPISIFEMLTTKNPDVINIPIEDKTQSRGTNWHAPKVVRVWKEFDFPALKEIYNGMLLRAAHQARPDQLQYPLPISSFDRVIKNEHYTANAYTAWNREVVNKALKAVAGQFNSTVWTLPETRQTMSMRSASTDIGGLPTPGRACKRSANSTPVSTKLYPDAGAVLFATISDNTSASTDNERLPKDYKTYSKWNMEKLKRKLGDNGEVGGRARTSGAMWPIRQIYNYCVKLKCRYGCILTTGEAFIFRIRPQSKIQPSSANVDKMTWSLIADGLMEYACIPWDTHNPEKSESFEGLTVNLALWFVHILAGNHHEIDWTYGLLKDETLATRPYRTPADTPASGPARRASNKGPNRQKQISPSVLGKRKTRESDSDSDDEDDDEDDDSDGGGGGGGGNSGPQHSFMGTGSFTEAVHRGARREIVSDDETNMHSGSDHDADSTDDGATSKTQVKAVLAEAPTKRLRSGRQIQLVDG